MFCSFDILVFHYLLLGYSVGSKELKKILFCVYVDPIKQRYYFDFNFRLDFLSMVCQFTLH